MNQDFTLLFIKTMFIQIFISCSFFQLLNNVIIKDSTNNATTPLRPKQALNTNWNHFAFIFDFSAVYPNF